MNNQEFNFESEISLVDIVVRVLQSWKKALLAIIIGAGVLAGYITIMTINPKVVSDLSTVQIEEKEAKISENEDLITVKEDEIAVNKKAIGDLENSIATNETNIEGKKAEIQYIEVYIENLNALEEIYQSTADVILSANIVGEEFASDMMNVTVKIVDTQREVLDSEVTILGLNKEIAELEKQNKITLPEKIEEIEEKNKEIQEEKMELIKENNELKEEVKKTTISEFSIIKVLILAVIGAVLGLGAFCGYKAFWLIFSNKIHSAQALQDGYGLHLLGELQDTEEKNKFIQKIISKLLGKRKDICADKEIEIINSKITALSKTNKIMVIGTIEASEIKNIVETLQGKNRNKAVELVAFGNPMYSPETLERLQDYELILVEKVDESSTKEITKLLRYLHKCEAEVLGVVVK